MIYTLPHKTISRDAVADDTQRMVGQGALMYLMCSQPPTKHAPALAIAHAQIEAKDPLRFFVTKEGDLIINPVITRHSNISYPKREGCTTFTQNVPWVLVQRYQKIEVEYYTLDEDTLEWVHHEEACSGKQAQIFQHEIDHMNAKYIYDIAWETIEKLNKTALKTNTVDNPTPIPWQHNHLVVRFWYEQSHQVQPSGFKARLL